MIIKIDDLEIKVLIERKKIKNLYMRIKDDLCLHITVNKYVSDNEIYRLINNNSSNIKKMYLKELSMIEKDNYFYYLGERYNIVIGNNKDVIFNGNNVFTNSIETLDKFSKKQCKIIFNERVNRILNMFKDIPDFNLKIRTMKTRWGVCNRKSNTVTLNSKLIEYDVSLIDYVIIHELCHFKHFNHSKSFWDEVSKYYPYYKTARKMLKD